MATGQGLCCRLSLRLRPRRLLGQADSESGGLRALRPAGLGPGWQQYQATELASESGPVGQGRAGTAGWDSVRNSNRVTRRRPGWARNYGIDLIQVEVGFYVQDPASASHAASAPLARVAPWQARQAWQGWNHDCLKMYCRDSTGTETQLGTSIYY